MSTIFIYGRPGTGKTTLATSMTNLGYNVTIVDVDQKADKMVNISHLIKAGKVTVIPISEKLTQLSMREKILTPALAYSKQPKGYLLLCDIINGFEKEILEGKTRQNEVIVIDSLTSVIEHFTRLISFMNKRDKFEFGEWKILLSNLEEFFYTMAGLQKLFKHIIIIAHEQVERDEDSGRILSILPAIEGSMRNKVSKYFEEVYRTMVTIKDGKAVFTIATKPMQQAEARTSRNMDLTMPSDFKILFSEEAK